MPKFRGIHISTTVKQRSTVVFLLLILLQSIAIPTVSALTAEQQQTDAINKQMAQNFAGPLQSKDAKYAAAADAAQQSDKAEPFANA